VPPSRPSRRTATKQDDLSPTPLPYWQSLFGNIKNGRALAVLLEQ